MTRAALALLVLVGPLAAHADEALEILARFDKLMGPTSFESTTEMVAHREDNTTRTYRMTILKAGTDKFRSLFLEPASAKGQEMLRVGDNLWVYMPNLKRALRMAARDSFMGGDFNNADVLRVSYSTDYTGTLVEKTAAHTLLECKAKNGTVAYDKIKLWVTGEGLPLKAQYFAGSGAMIRSAEFKDVKDFNGHKRPAVITMKNELVPARWSELRTIDLKVVDGFPETKFSLSALGK
jgi:outer membrane lipoprotein-sorting protein